MKSKEEEVHIFYPLVCFSCGNAIGKVNVGRHEQMIRTSHSDLQCLKDVYSVYPSADTSQYVLLPFR